MPKIGPKLGRTTSRPSTNAATSRMSPRRESPKRVAITEAAETNMSNSRMPPQSEYLKRVPITKSAETNAESAQTSKSTIDSASSVKSRRKHGQKKHPAAPPSLPPAWRSVRNTSPLASRTHYVTKSRFDTVNRPRPIRTVSEPPPNSRSRSRHIRAASEPPSKSRICIKPKPVSPTFYERLRAAFRWVRAPRLPRLSRPSMKQVAKGLAILALAISPYVLMKSVHYLTQPPPNINAILRGSTNMSIPDFVHDPTWLYIGSAPQMLGFPEPLFQRGVQPPSVTEKQYRQLCRYWCPDAGPKHKDANPGRTVLDKIGRRIAIARDQMYNRAPYNERVITCYSEMADNTGKQVLDLGLKDDGLPYYDPDCVCNVTRAVETAVKHAVLPWWKHENAPTDAEGLKKYCPCSIKKALHRLKFGFTHLPPPLRRFYGDPALLDNKPLGNWLVKYSGFGGSSEPPPQLSYPQEQLDQWRKEGWLGNGRGRNGNDLPDNWRPEMEKVWNIMNTVPEYN